MPEDESRIIIRFDINNTIITTIIIYLWWNFLEFLGSQRV